LRLSYRAKSSTSHTHHNRGYPNSLRYLLRYWTTRYSPAGYSLPRAGWSASSRYHHRHRFQPGPGYPSNQVRVTLNTKGKLEMLSAENELVTLDYTPETLANTVDLALRLAPGQTLSSYQQFVERFPVYPFLINYVNQFFYRFLPLQLSVILIPQQ